MTKPAKPDTRVSIHMLMNDRTTLQLVTSSLEKVEKTVTNNPKLRPFLDVDPLVVAQFLDGRMPCSVIDDDAAWKVVAPAIMTFYQHLQMFEEAGCSPTYPTTPPDIPMTLAISRGQVIENYPQLADLPAAIEISEVVKARQNRRSVDTSLFRTESLCSSWASFYEVDPRSIYEEHQRLSSQLNEGLDDPLGLALCQQHLRELQFVIDDIEAMHEGDSPSASVH